MTKLKRRRATRRPGTSALVFSALVVGAAAVAGLLYLQRSQDSAGGVDLPNSETAFSIPDHVGQPAPAFAAIGLDSSPHSVTPGDGRPKVLVFYMGYL